jgi:hypothetical protein
MVSDTKFQDVNPFLVSGMERGDKRNGQYTTLKNVTKYSDVYEGVSKSFRTGRLARELKIVQLSATMCSCIAILWVSLVGFAAITLCVASERVFIVVSICISLLTQSGNFWLHSSISRWTYSDFILMWLFAMDLILTVHSADKHVYHLRTYKYIYIW